MPVRQISQKKTGKHSRNPAERLQRARPCGRSVDPSVDILNEQWNKGRVELPRKHHGAHEKQKRQCQRKVSFLGSDRTEKTAVAVKQGNEIFMYAEQNQQKRNQHQKTGDEESGPVSEIFRGETADESAGQSAGKHRAVQGTERKTAVFLRRMRCDKSLSRGNRAA